METVLYSRLKQTLLLLVASYLLFPSVLAVNFKYCDKKGNYPVKVEGVRISPNPVVTGQPTTFDISASTVQSITGGKVVIEVSLFAVPVHKETIDLCDEVSCPISVGSFVLSHTQTLPIFTPPGSYTLKMTMTDKSKGQLTCISFNFKIGVGSSISDN